MSTDQIEREVTIEAPVERVWALITEPEHVGTWFGDAGAEIDLRPGGDIEFRWHEHGNTLAITASLGCSARACSTRWATLRPAVSASTT